MSTVANAFWRSMNIPQTNHFLSRASLIFFVISIREWVVVHCYYQEKYKEVGEQVSPKEVGEQVSPLFF